MSQIEQGTGNLIADLLESKEPSIRLQVRLGVQDAVESDISDMREQVRRSSRVATLLSERAADRTINAHPYRAKWYGAHWVLVTLAELGYPAGDETLIPRRDQTLSWLFTDDYLSSLGRVRGLPRLHCSIEGNTLWAMLTLGLANDRAELLAKRLHGSTAPSGPGRMELRPQGQRQELLVCRIPHSAARARLSRSEALRQALRPGVGRGG